MEDLPALSPRADELLFTLVNCALFLAVAIASYRRSRCLSRYPIWKSLAAGAIAGAFWPIWVAVSVFNREQIAYEWGVYRRELGSAPGTCR